VPHIAYEVVQVLVGVNFQAEVAAVSRTCIPPAAATLSRADEIATVPTLHATVFGGADRIIPTSAAEVSSLLIGVHTSFSRSVLVIFRYFS
jgi:hypothetical protein